ncbi:unnamed protein product [Caenorhabditis bovis]|uniref:Uncharacterized protein n=1 Tax=Caenorhabditis bovis TaxID=2654633 RepID=A0A8S1EYH7_9PELO|nr:unnamed protein product [Caenorhabditis bovis]
MLRCDHPSKVCDNMLSEREQLSCLVQQWNENRLDLFHLSYPTEDLEIEGVMRFYFQDGGEKVLTKCVRVSSTATTRAVVDALQEKFLPDLKMLSNDTYSLWEVHENGDERRLDEEEKPLLVQLMWHKDDREGRFLLRRNIHPSTPLSSIQFQESDVKNGRFNKKKEKELRKKHQQNKEIVHVNSGREEAQNADDIYKQVPFNTFTRTISNPEAVMRKRREKKLETKLKEMTYGGSLKVYGAEIIPSRPYVTILAGMHDTAERILAESLEKYGLDNHADEFMLVEITNGSDEPRKSMSDLREMDGRPINPHECPLVRMAAQSGENGFESFLAIKRKPHDYQIPSTSVIPQTVTIPQQRSPVPRNLPTLTILNPDRTLSTHQIVLHPGLTEVGSDREMSNFSPHNIYLDGFDIRGRHAAIAIMEGVVTLTPSTPDAYLEINGAQIMQTEILRDGDTIRIGADNLFRFGMPRDSSYGDMPDSRASTTRCGVQSDYGSLPLNGNDYYPPSVSGSSDTSNHQKSHHHDDQTHSNNMLPSYSKNGLETVPISIQIGDYNVWDFLGEVMSLRAATSPDTASFRLSPAYALYLALRFFHNHSKPYVVQFFGRIETNFRQIASDYSSRDDLIFWLANASELNNLIEMDGKLKAARFGKLGMEIERIFRKLVGVLQGALRPVTRPLLNTSIADREATSDLINFLDASLRVMRSCYLNPALTIQLCAHMLHIINAFLFNNLVAVGFPPIPLTSRLGKCLQNRLDLIYRYCERMGVELPAECHLDRTRQAANLLAAPKNDVAALGSTCYKLNSLQVVHLLSSFEHTNGEIPCDDDVIDRIVRLAEKQADQLTSEDGQRVTLEEADDLNMPFLIPQDGYFIEGLKSVPDGLWQYLQQLQNRRLCHSVSKHGNEVPPNRTVPHIMSASMTEPKQRIEPIVRSVSQTTLTSIPTTQFGDSFGSMSAASEPIVRVTLHKNGGGIGLSIVAAQGVGDRRMGIYVKKVVEGTPAALDGRLETGDQLLSVNGHSLLGISQEEAAKLMTSSGNDVHFEVRKRAAHRNGLSAWLVANTPTTSTASHHFVPPSPSMSSASHPPPPPPPSYSHASRNSVDAPPPMYNGHHGRNGYQTNSVQPSRNSAFVTPMAVGSANSHLQQHMQMHNMAHQNATDSTRHYRSSSASDLIQNDANASFSQSSLNSARSSVFDKLPAHYRHSARPTVIQPARPGAQSPSALRRGAQSPSNLYRPTSASNLFAPPRQATALAGYSSTAARESTQDLHRALNDLDLNSPLARSTPNEEDYHRHRISSNYHQLPVVHSRPSSVYGYQSQISPSTSSITANGVFKPTTNLSGVSTSPRVNVNSSRVYSSPPQEPAVVRPVELNMPTTKSTSVPHIKGAVPTAITQALQLQQSNGAPLRQIRPPSGLRDKLLDADVRQLEKTNIALMSYEAVNEELDRLDMKGHNMTEEETRRYRELLNVAAEQSRARRLLADVRPPAHIERNIPVVVQKTPEPAKTPRTETVIDDVPNSSSSIENVSPVSQQESKRVQFIDDLSAADVPVLDSPGIVGTNEIYRDPRQRRLNEIQQRANNTGSDGANLGFRDKQRLFARQLGEEGTPRQRIDVSSAQRQIESETSQN